MERAGFVSEAVIVVVSLAVLWEFCAGLLRRVHCRGQSSQRDHPSTAPRKVVVYTAAESVIQPNCLRRTRDDFVVEP